MDIDRYVTGGSYSTEHLIVWCEECETWTAVTATTEFGTTEWSPAQCRDCGAPFPDDAEAQADEPPEPDRDDWDDRWDDPLDPTVPGL